MTATAGDAERLVDRDGDRFRTNPPQPPATRTPDASKFVVEKDFVRCGQALWEQWGAEYMRDGMGFDRGDAETHAKRFVAHIVARARIKAGWRDPEDVGYVKTGGRFR